MSELAFKTVFPTSLMKKKIWMLVELWELITSTGCRRPNAASRHQWGIPTNGKGGEPKCQNQKFETICWAWSRHLEGYLWGFNICPAQSMAWQEMFLKAPRALDPSDCGYYAPIRHLCGKFQRHSLLACLLVIVRAKSKNHYPRLPSENRTAFGIKIHFWFFRKL